MGDRSKILVSAVMKSVSKLIKHGLYREMVGGGEKAYLIDRFPLIINGRVERGKRVAIITLLCNNTELVKLLLE